MIELFEQDIKTIDRQSSKGNQLKWKKDDIWYKADYTGYEGLAEFTISSLLNFCNLKKEEFVSYSPIQIKYEDRIFSGASSKDLLKDDWQIITLERLFKNMFNISLNSGIWKINDIKQRLQYIVDQVESVTGLKNFGPYMSKIITIDTLFLNEDRHTHNLAVLMNTKGEFDYCPIFDNGAGLLADTTIDYPMDKDIFNLMKKVKSKTFSTNMDEQLESAESLYGCNIKFTFTKKDIDHILALDGKDNNASIYPLEIRERVRDILYEQIRRYPYLFKH